MRSLSFALLAAAALLPAAASSQPVGRLAAAQAAPQCFFEQDWKGWKAVDDKSMYIRVGQKKIFRVDFQHGCPGLTSPNAHLITHGFSPNICRAIDLDIKVSDLQGFSTPCIATGLTPLTPEEAAALPKKDIP